MCEGASLWCSLWAAIASSMREGRGTRKAHLKASPPAEHPVRWRCWGQWHSWSLEGDSHFPGGTPQWLFGGPGRPVPSLSCSLPRGSGEFLAAGQAVSPWRPGCTRHSGRRHRAVGGCGCASASGRQSSGGMPSRTLDTRRVSSQCALSGA